MEILPRWTNFVGLFLPFLSAHYDTKKVKKSQSFDWYQIPAEARGFEPPIQFPECRFSKPVPSTTQPLLRVFTAPYYHFLHNYQKMLLFVYSAKLQRSGGPIVYRLGHKLFKLGSRVRLSVGSQEEIKRFSKGRNPERSLYFKVFPDIESSEKIILQISSAVVSNKISFHLIRLRSTMTSIS